MEVQYVWDLCRMLSNCLRSLWAPGFRPLFFKCIPSNLIPVCLSVIMWCNGLLYFLSEMFYQHRYRLENTLLKDYDKEDPAFAQYEYKTKPMYVLFWTTINSIDKVVRYFFAFETLSTLL